MGAKQCLFKHLFRITFAIFKLHFARFYYKHFYVSYLHRLLPCSKGYGHLLQILASDGVGNFYPWTYPITHILLWTVFIPRWLASFDELSRIPVQPSFYKERKTERYTSYSKYLICKTLK